LEQDAHQEGAPSVEAWAAAGLLRDIDVHLARRLGRIAGEERADVLLAVAVVHRRLADGHVCLDFDGLGEGPTGPAALLGHHRGEAHGGVPADEVVSNEDDPATLRWPPRAS